MKFLSVPSRGYQQQGLLLENAAGQAVRVDVHSTGTDVRAFVATLTPTTAVTRISRSVGTSADVWLRVRRAGSTWTVWHSGDGATWNSWVLRLHVARRPDPDRRLCGEPPAHGRDRAGLDGGRGLPDGHLGADQP